VTTLLGFVIGVVAGVASGVAGVGGGVIMIPAMTSLLAVPQHVAQGTSLMAILFTAASGTYINVRNRHVRLRQAAVIGITGVITAQIGAQLALGTDQELLQRIFGVVVVYSGLHMLFNIHRKRRLQR
jgi:uncharacterized protein